METARGKKIIMVKIKVGQIGLDVQSLSTDRNGRGSLFRGLHGVVLEPSKFAANAKQNPVQTANTRVKRYVGQARTPELRFRDRGNARI
ncbi:hypothetical protein RRG08_026772 [Elysia crispata]|uniref:Uncharacterized protein n=1 Tax=Elysia crispata TaxID=231223 RepID=A0AAE1AQC0_9GAST|nr:hypothetical protein RRG08_026772 [Elysia crispata]